MPRRRQGIGRGRLR